MKALFLVAAIVSVFLPAAVSTASPRQITYHCNDLVVIGRVSVLGEQLASSSSPLPNWNRLYELRLRIKRVVRGSARKRTISATVIAHDPIRSDRDFLAVLRPTDAETYVLEAATLWDTRHHPVLTEPCR
jgi:hypothetical protein